MGITFRELLGDLRVASLYEQDKGGRFERLIKPYLETTQERTERFSEVRQSGRPGRREAWPERLHHLLADCMVLILAVVDGGTSPRTSIRPCPEWGEIGIDESAKLPAAGLCWSGSSALNTAAPVARGAGVRHSDFA
ncbi:hypothetical protein MXD61_15985 [Frankia sp. AgPm24]|uniref:hypothetical protein n=1 Tax=Frankia sp. AgPm24 TaxID=631128 RepID=UPI00200C19FD|nr:hypothetical protein [Frankia sp. AgPm24]MCK9923353.1 hypothetical protein [Frankia sp. AgPm24]